MTARPGFLILAASEVGTTVTLPVAVECEHCHRAAMMIVHNPLVPGVRCSGCAEKQS